MIIKNNNLKPIGFSKSSAKRKVHNNVIPCQERRETSNKRLNLTLENNNNNNKISTREGTINMSAKINEKEMKTKAMVNKTKSWFFAKINNIDQQLPRHIMLKKKGGGKKTPQINKIKNRFAFL